MQLKVIWSLVAMALTLTLSAKAVWAAESSSPAPITIGSATPAAAGSTGAHAPSTGASNKGPEKVVAENGANANADGKATPARDANPADPQTPCYFKSAGA